MKHLCAAAAFATFAAATPAHAGDYADKTILGFSPDNRYFAFIEYGVQDGSGFPYANAYVIDTTDDSWVKGTPVRKRIDDESATLNQVVSETMAALQPIVAARQIGVPATTVAASPMTELSDDPTSVTFLKRLLVPMDTSRAFTLKLTEKPLPLPDCPDMGEPFMGLTLTLEPPSGDAITLVDDGKIPASRKCPLNYRIAEVLVSQDTSVLVVLLDVLSVGFEGPDRRYLAVTAPLPE